MPTIARLVLVLAADLDRCLDHVLERRLVREEVEALEDHADVLALARDVASVSSTSFGRSLRDSRSGARSRGSARLDLLEMVDAADEGGLARTRRRR